MDSITITTTTSDSSCSRSVTSLTLTRLFSNVPDVDREILLRTPDEELYAVYLSCKYAQEICNKYFWYDRFVLKFKTDLVPTRAKINYNQVYAQMIKLDDDMIFIESSKIGYITLIKNFVESNRVNGYHRNKAFLYAAANGHIDIVKYLLEKGLEIDASGYIESMYDDALRLASQYGHFEIVKYLVDLHKNINIYENAIKTAAEVGYLDILKYLLDHCGPFYDITKTNLIVITAQKGHLHIIKYLESIGIDIHFNNEFPLWFASKHGHFEIVKYLIEHDQQLGYTIDINIGDDPALVCACREGHLDIVKYLHAHGANLTYMNNLALKAAAMNGKLEIIMYLLDNGVNINVLTNRMLAPTLNLNEIKRRYYRMEDPNSMLFGKPVSLNINIK